MSHVSWSRVFVALVTSLVLAAGGLLLVPVTATPNDPPEPYSVDACGTNKELIVIPSAGTYGALNQDGETLNANPGMNNVEGATSVTAMKFDDNYKVVASWTFTYTNAPCGAEAKDTYRVEVGECGPKGVSGVYVPVTVWVTNTADEYRLYASLYTAWAWGDAGSQADGTVRNVLDGDTQPISLRADFGTSPGMYPGEVIVDVFKGERTNTPAVRLRFTIPPCNGYVGTDPPTPYPIPYSGTPKGKVKLLRCRMHKVVAIMDTRAVTQGVTPYRLIQKRKGTKAKISPVSRVKPGKVARLYRKGRPGTVFTLQVKKPDTSWKNLSQRRVKYRC